MADSPVQGLLGAVRRRLWQLQFVAAVRLALWGSVGLLLLAVAVHLAARRVAAGAVVMAVAVLWTSMLAWAGWRRPTESACALWADRHLGGACAFTTLLEMGDGTHARSNAQAVRWLEQWATAKVPDSQRLLAGRRESARLSRALLSVLVCAALATFVLTLPGLAPSPSQPLATSSPVSIADRPLPIAEAPASAELVSEVASALRSARLRDASAQREAGGAPAAGPGKTDDGKRPPTGQAGVMPAGEQASAGGASSATPVEALPAPGAAQTAGAGSRRDAGESRDERADVGVSRALRDTIAVQRSGSRALLRSGEGQADMDQSATYDEERPVHATAGMRANPAPAAATPPPATESTRLTPTETSYVQAWMTTRARRP